MTIDKLFEIYAREDADTIVRGLNVSAGTKFEVVDIVLSSTDGIDDSDEVVPLSAKVSIKDENGASTKFTLKYEWDDALYALFEVRPTVEMLKRRLNKSKSVKSARIVAAEEDVVDDEFVDDVIDDASGLDDRLDDIQDTVENMQDDIDDIQEDDTLLEVDNNIADHYICECERCHGIFISALIESEQQVDHVSGICPLCDEETDQYIKWIIRDVKADEG